MIIYLWDIVLYVLSHNKSHLFWNIRRLLFSNVLEYSKTSLFEYSFCFQNVLIDRTTKILLLATNLTTFPNNHEKQAERCIKIYTLVIDASDEFHNVRARRTLAGDQKVPFLLPTSFSLFLSLCVGFASICNDRQLKMVSNPFLNFFGTRFAPRFNPYHPFGHKYHSPWQKLVDTVKRVTVKER